MGNIISKCGINVSSFLPGVHRFCGHLCSAICSPLAGRFRKSANYRRIEIDEFEEDELYNAFQDVQDEDYYGQNLDPGFNQALNQVILPDILNCVAPDEPENRREMHTVDVVPVKREYAQDSSEED